MGLIHIGLGDWLPINYKTPYTPLEVTDTLVTLNLCRLAEKMFAAVDMIPQSIFAGALFNEIREDARKVLILPDGATIMGSKIVSKWVREGDLIKLTVEVPEGCYGFLNLPKGYSIHDNKYRYAHKSLNVGVTEYIINVDQFNILFFVITFLLILVVDKSVLVWYYNITLVW